MAKKYDTIMKRLIVDHAVDWLAFLGVPKPGEVKEASPDLAATTSLADVVLERGNELEHIDAQAGWDGTVVRRLFMYNALAHGRTGKAVRSTLLLLTKKADSPTFTGEYGYGGGECASHFRYRLIRLWRVPAEELLAAGPGVAPLASLAELPKGATPEEEVRRIVEAIDGEPAEDRKERLVTASYIMAGLRHGATQIEDWFQGAYRKMEESSTYQAIIAKGVAVGRREGREEGLREGRTIGSAEGRRQTVIEQATDKFGEPAADALSKIEQIDDPGRLRRLGRAVLTASSWDELLSTP